MSGRKRTGNNASQGKQSKLVFSGIALATMIAQAALAAGTKPLPIERIGMDSSRQLVVQFASQPGAFPSVPNVLDLPGPNHRVVLEFADATIDKANIATPEVISAAIAKILPSIRGVRYSNVANAAKPIVRIVLDLPEDLKVQPRVVKLEESSVTINFGEAVQNLKVSQARAVNQNVDAVAGAPVPTDAGAPPVTTAAVSSADMTADVNPTVVSTASATTVESSPAAVTTTTIDTAIASATTAPVTAATSPQIIAAEVPELKPAVPAPPVTTSGGWDWTAPVKPANVTATKSEITTVSTTEAPALVQTPEAAHNPIRVIDEDSKPAVITPITKPDAPAVVPTEEVPHNPIRVIDEDTKPTGAALPGLAPVKPDEVQPTAKQVDAAVNGKTDSAPAATDIESTMPASSAPAAPVAPVTPEGPKSTTSAQAAVKLYNAAVKSHLSGKLTEAIADYKGALAANPALAEAHSNLGLIYNQQHNYAGALAEFHKALAINPKDAITYNGIGAALRAEKDLLGAIRNWQTAVDIDPKLATAHYNLGTAFEIQKDYDRALEAYKDAVTNDYRLGEAYYRMGLIMERKHRLEDAAAQFKEALKVSATSEYSEDARQRLAFLKTQKH